MYSTDSLPGTYHRRELKPPAVGFSSAYGRKLFREALEEGSMECYFPLSEQFITQGHPSFCGIGSLTMALNSLLLDPNRIWQGVWRWFDESMLDCCEPHDLIKLKGLTLAKVGCLARCNQAEAVVKYSDTLTIDEFREDVARVSSQSVDDNDRKVLIVSYSRSVLHQTGSGHFSPIGGYHKASDMVLIMDVARFKYPPHWVPLSLLFEAMKTVDSESGKSRGYLLISKPTDIDADLINYCENHCRNEERATNVDDANATSAIIHDRIDSIVKHNCKYCKP